MPRVKLRHMVSAMTLLIGGGDDAGDGDDDADDDDGDDDGDDVADR